LTDLFAFHGIGQSRSLIAHVTNPVDAGMTRAIHARKKYQGASRKTESRGRLIFAQFIRAMNSY
jgi:pyruvate/2-oxoglutarate dehydrogenase complex dihydrolipoamide acyltransferase (E2) component